MASNSCLHNLIVSSTYVHYCTVSLGPGLKLGTSRCCASTLPIELYPQPGDLPPSSAQSLRQGPCCLGDEGSGAQEATFFQEDGGVGETLSWLCYALNDLKRLPGILNLLCHHYTGMFVSLSR